MTTRSTLHRVFTGLGILLKTQWGTWGPAYDVRVVRMGALRTVVLHEQLLWVDPNGDAIVIPVGFTCDGASLPAAAWWILGGKLSLEWISAAIVHDYACLLHASKAKAMAPTSAVAAERFYRGLRADGMGWARAAAARRAVMLFGPRW